MNRSPAFQPRASARARSGGSSSSASKMTSPASAMTSRAARQRLDGSSPRPSASGTRSGGVEGQVVDPQEPDEVADGAERRQALLDDRQQRAELVVGRHPVDPAGGELRLDERPQPVDQVVRVEPADPLAVEPLEPLAIEDGAALVDVASSSKRSTISSSERTSSSRAGRPAEQREVVDERLADEALGDVVRRPPSGSCACSSSCGRR